MTYDKNGNILSLNRTGGYDTASGVIEIDHLSYTYDEGNQLQKVTDATNSTQGFKNGSNTTDDYDYDANGNMIMDENKDIREIRYNYLNLPTTIKFGNNNQIEYIYDATGIKLAKIVTEDSNTTTTQYLAGFQYKEDELQFFPTAEGYVNVTNTYLAGTKYTYVYNYTDHLGNIRVSYAQDPNNPLQLKIMEENNYYPFGLKHQAYNQPAYVLKRAPERASKLKFEPKLTSVISVALGNVTNSNNYKYQGQERQEELGLNWDSFKWRNYDYAIGRFMSVDPLSEKYPQYGNYVFSGNIVVAGREQEGLEPYAPYGSLQEAAENFGQQYNGVSILNNVELGTTFYSKTDNENNKTYSYVTPGGAMMFDNFGNRISNDTPNYTGEDLIPKGGVKEGGGHTHAWDKNLENREESSDSNSVSDGDKQYARLNGPEFVVTPNGSLLLYAPKNTPTDENRGRKPISTDLPSDPLSPTRKNEVSPNITPDVMPILDVGNQGKEGTPINPNKIITAYDPDKQINQKLPNLDEYTSE